MDNWGQFGQGNGIVPIADLIAFFYIHREEEKIADDRIVHGYTPPERGFMVLIRSYWDIQRLDITGANGCTGSIINNRLVLTALN